MTERRSQIGEVAEVLSLSLRTIRYYEEVGLIVPDRTAGGFRLYSDDDVERLRLLRHMKPLDFSLDEMRDLLEVRDRVADEAAGPEQAAAAAERLAMYAEAATQRCDALRAQLENAEVFALSLHQEVRRARAARR